MSEPTKISAAEVLCPLCDGRFEQFLPTDFGVRRRPSALCPRCRSLERHRLLWLYLQRKTNFFERMMRVLHFSAEPALERRVRGLPKIQYVTADLARKAMVKTDITAIAFADETFDAILCMHVLEHVQDDRRAMRELLRVLKLGGWAILQVPINETGGPTLEDPAATTPEDRLRIYGQRDHVRLYGSDYHDRLAACGFDVTVDPFARDLDEETVKTYGLLRSEDVYFCRKGAA
jgi:SAM-dependent methyltransferase